MRVFGISNCDKCREAKKWLAKKEIDFEFIDFRKQTLTAEDIKKWIKNVGEEKLINKRGTTWRALPAPSKIENLLTLSPEIEQACVFGEQKNYIAALLVLSSESKSSDEDIQRYIDEVNKDLTQPEKIKKFIFIDEPFSIENNLMTPTMKVRRHEVQKKYQNRIDQLF